MATANSSWAVRPVGSVALGAYIPSFPPEADAIQGFRGRTGPHSAIVHYFQSWSRSTRDFDPEAAAMAYSVDAVPMISWEPWEWPDVVVGKFDSYIRAYAAAVRRFGRPILIRFAHEMNGMSIPWRDRPERFCATWRRVHGIFTAEGAASVGWVWSPYVVDRNARRFEGFYPGNEYVDWVALDGYNWGRSGPLSTWRNFDQIFGESYRRLRALAPSLPLMLAEIGCAERGGDKAHWIRDAFLDAIPKRYPEVDAVVWFNQDRPDHADWRIDSSTAALAAWREVSRHPHYQGRLVRR